jgi:hypothetical protein
LFKESQNVFTQPLCILNNSAFHCRGMKGKMKDSFEEAGTGFGETYKFRYYPARDYIFADEKIES